MPGRAPGTPIMLEDPVQQKLAAEIARLVHADQKFDAARLFIDTCELDLTIKDEPGDYIPILQNWLHFLLNSNAMQEAAQLLWTPNLFNPKPKCSQQVWQLFDTSELGLIMGAASMSKSFTMGVRLLLEYIRDPDYTSIRLIGPSEDHLEQNLFSHITSLHQNASLPMPGKSGTLFIGESRRQQLGSVKGIVIPIGKTKKAGRIQGTKRKGRKKEHPVFGPLSRMFIFIDEIENVPGGVWSDIDNALSMADEQGHEGFKIFGAYNPSNQTDEVAKRAEPTFGWENLDIDKHFRWKSKRGWNVLRLDGEQSENVIAGKEIYPGLQTAKGLGLIAANAGGTDTPGYMTMGRGMYPVTGVKLTVIPAGMLPTFRGEFIWVGKPTSCGSVDLALEGGASAIYTLGKYGRASGMKLPPSLEHPDGQTIMFKGKHGRSVTRMGLQIEQQFILPKGDTVKMALQIKSVSQKAGVRPNWMTVDRTGNGAGVHDLLKNIWGPEVRGINFYHGATEMKIAEEDTLTCKEEYDRMCSELWFALRKWGEFRYVLLHPSMDMSKLTQQLTNRLYRPIGKKNKVESKKDYIARGFESPDEADSLTLIVQGVRMEAKHIISMAGTDAALLTNSDDDDDWPGMDFRIDETNRTDTLELQ